MIKFKFVKKIIVMFGILFIQGTLLYVFYYNEDFIFDLKTAYLKQIYLPSYAYSFDKVKSNTVNNLANVSAIFSRNNFHENISVGDHQNELMAKSIPVLLYHGVIENPDGSNILLEDFKNQMFALKKNGWQTVGIGDFYQFIKGEKELPDKSFLLTFDDGRKDSYYPVDPILKALDYNAVMFVITKYSLRDNNSNYYLSKKELKRMIKNGRWEIGAHTREGHDTYKISLDGRDGHFYSNKLWLDNENRLEIEEEYKNRITADFVAAKDDIEQGLGVKVVAFAYPFGDFGQNSINFPESERIVSDAVKSIYPMSFYQVWPGRGFSFNYPKSDVSLIKRIDVKPDWRPKELITLLDAGREKPLPYFDNFEKYDGWIKTWGDLTWGDNSLILSATDSNNGGAVFLDGTRLWEDYVFMADVHFKKGQTYSVIAGYRDNSNYIFCSFTPSGIRLEQISGGERKILNEFKGKFNLLDKEKNVGIGFASKTASCYLNGKRVIDTSGVDEGLDNGSIGFKTWNPQANNSELIVKEVFVKKIK